VPAGSHNEILLFYGWWQLSVCVFACLALLSIWWHIGRKRGDFGQVWLALSIACWSLSGASEVIFAKGIVNREITLDGLRSIFSLFNSMFILLALPWFKYLPKALEPIINSDYWKIIIGLPFLFSLFPTINKIWFGKSSFLISELDVYFALLTLVFLGAVLWTSFRKRRLPLLAYLSLISIGVTLIAQLYKLTDADINLTLFSAIFKTCLIMIFFALALSWVRELSENIFPDVRQLNLALSSSLIRGKNLRTANIQGLTGKESVAIPLSPRNYDLLSKFIVSKLENPAEGWLEIKPKEGVRGREYDIKDHNEIKRLLHALLDGIFGVNCWTKEHHYAPLKDTLFELSDKRTRLVRLRLNKTQLSVNQ